MGKAPLARTLADHKARGSSPPHVLADNPGKTLAEVMSDQEIFEYMCSQFSGLVSFDHIAKTRRDAPFLEAFARARDEIFAPDLDYLREINRAPSIFKDLNPVKQFPIPEPR